MDDFKLATMLDPHLKLEWCQNDESHDVRDLPTSLVVWLSPTSVWNWIGIALFGIDKFDVELELEKMELTQCLGNMPLHKILFARS